MAGRIAGITIEIDGNTTKLEKALSGVNKTLKETQRDLKDVNKLLKLDPGNTTLLTQKQKLLQKTVDETKKKLEKEKEALKQLKEGDTSPEVAKQQDALEREIIETENALKSAEDELKSFGSVGVQQAKAVASKMQEVGGKVTAVGEEMTKKVTVPIVAAGGASVAAWKEVDDALDTVTVKTGATGKALEDMQTSVKNLAKSIPTDFATAGEAVGEVNTRFGLTGKALEDLSGDFIRFAQLNDTDVSSSIDGVQRVMAAFNVDASEAGNVLDLLTKVGQDTGLTMDALEGSLQNNAVALKEMGFGLSDSAVFLGQLEKSGADSNAVLAGLKKALQNAAKEGKPMSTALDDVQKSIEGAKTDTEATQIAMELFGNKAGPAIAKAVREGKLSFTELGTSLSDYSGTVSNTFEETLDPLDKMQTTMNNLKLIGADIVETSGPAIESVMQTLAGIVEQLSQKWNGLTQEQQEGILKAALVVAALGPVITVIGGVISAVGGLIGGLSTIIPFITGTLIPTVTAGAAAFAPFLGAGAIAVGIGIAAAFIIKNWDKIKAGLIALGKIVKQQWNEIKTSISNAVTVIKTTVEQKWNAIKTSVTNAVNNIKTAVSQKWAEIKNSVSSTIESMKSTITSKWTAIKTSVSNTVNGIKTSISEGFNSAKSKVSSIFSSIQSTITSKINAAKSAVSSAVSKIKGFMNFSWSLPKLKMPHFTKSGEFSLNPPSVPKFSVSWYKKAYDSPVMFTKPTILQTPQGLKGFGDGHGGEVVLSENKLRAMMRGSGGDTYNLNIYPSAGMDVNALANAVQYRLVALQRQKESAGIA